jgi:UDP-N-acetylglucosamine 4-epimerase
MNILLTGNSGFIGSHICDRLLENGHFVIGIDNLSSGNLKNQTQHTCNPNFKFYQYDICDVDGINHVFENHKIDVVCHQAAKGSVPYSFKHPMLYKINNEVGFFNILDCCRRYDVKKVVYASSSSVYGDREFRTETDACTPLSPYAFSKLSNEEDALFHEQQYGIKTIGLRYFNVVGARQNSDGDYAAVLPSFCKQASLGKSLSINQDDIFDYTITRHFTSVDFVADLNVRLIENGWDDSVLNVCSQESVSLINLAKYVNAVYNRSLESVEYVGRRVGDVKKADGCTKILNKYLEPLSNSINVTKIINTIGWFKKEFERGQGI